MEYKGNHNIGERGGAEQHPERECKSWRPAAAPPHFTTERLLGQFFSRSSGRLGPRDVLCIRFVFKSCSTAGARGTLSGAGAKPRILIYFDRQLIAAGCL